MNTLSKIAQTILISAVALSAHAASGDARLDAIVAQAGTAAASTSAWTNAYLPDANGTQLIAAGGETYGDASFNRVVGQHAHGDTSRGVWNNAMMAHGTGRYAVASADEVLQKSLLVYTRSMLDRNGWVNAYVGGSGYDGGNSLVTVALGYGITTRAA